MRSFVYSNQTNGTLGQTIDLVGAEFRRVPSVINAYALVANTAQNVAIDTGNVGFVTIYSVNPGWSAVIPYFVCDANVAVASLPTGSVTTGLASEFMPTQYNVGDLTANGLSVISPTSGYLIVSMYAKATSTANI